MKTAIKSLVALSLSLASISALAAVRPDATVTASPLTEPSKYATNHYFLGLSYQRNWVSQPLFRKNNEELKQLMVNLGPGVIRFNAERPLYPVIWNKNGNGTQYGEVSRKDMDRLYLLLHHTGWKVIYGIAIVGNTPEQAADEAQQAQEAFGDRLMAIEIGNESDNYGKDVYPGPNGTKFAQIEGYNWDAYIASPQMNYQGKALPSFIAIAEAIEKAAPGVVIAGPATGIAWNLLAMQTPEVAKHLGMITRHYYRASRNNWPKPTVEDLLSTDPRLAIQWPQEIEMAKAAGIRGGVRIGETNNISAGPMPGVSDSFAAALWTVDFLFQNAELGSSGINFNGGANAPYSPIKDNGAFVTGVGPDYYGMMLYHRATPLGSTIMKTTVEPALSGFNAYSVQQPDGTTVVILNNKTTSPISLALDRPGASTGATAMTLKAASVKSTTNFFLGGVEIPPTGDWKPISVWGLPVVNNKVLVTVSPGTAQFVRIK